MKDQAINASICLSDIPKEMIKEGKNGKKYLNISLNGMKSPNEDVDCYVFIQQTKEQREAKADKVILGYGRTKYFATQWQQPQQQAQAEEPTPEPPAVNDDLPF